VNSIKPAKYAQQITVYKDNHLNLLPNRPSAAVQLMEAAKLKSVQESLIVKK
jgi:hypothetical protein